MEMISKLSAIIEPMITLLHILQKMLRPELNERPAPTRYLLMGEVVGLLYSLPLVMIGLSWLAFTREIDLTSRDWPWLILVLMAIIIFSRLRFFMMHSMHSGHVVGSYGDFVWVILWASLLVLGPSVIWLFLFWSLVELVLSYRRAVNRDMKWESLRTVSLNAAALLIPTMIALAVYQSLGGFIPIAGLNPDSLWPAMGAVLAFAVSFFLVWLPFILYVIWVQDTKFNRQHAGSLFWFAAATIGIPFIALPLGVLASGIYVEHGWLVLALYFFGLFLVALLAHQLSRSAEKSRRQTEQLLGLERLGLDILAMPTDARDLPALLRQHIPDMFPCRRAAVWLTPETYLLLYPDARDAYTPDIWDWLMTQLRPQGYLENELLPWEGAPAHHHALLTAPIIDSLSGEPIGGLFIELLALPERWDRQTLREHFPALHNLTAQIATALGQAQTLQDTLINERVAKELQLAGEIQSSFLPDRPPEVPGWDIAASLTPARQTSGDFYDFFWLEDGKLGFIIADVADKGLGAALYMALGRTLLLTYAQVFPSNPAAVFHATNQRMLSDARAQMFITAFYGVLDPHSGRLIYCNAGHHPPIMIGKDGIQKLNPNGMALGIDQDAAWVAISQRIEVGDTLTLYTDGVVEALNPEDDFYGTEQLVKILKEIPNRPSQWMIRAVWEDLLNFQRGVLPNDDVTLVCLRRRA